MVGSWALLISIYCLDYRTIHVKPNQATALLPPRTEKGNGARGSIVSGWVRFYISWECAGFLLLKYTNVQLEYLWPIHFVWGTYLHIISQSRGRLTRGETFWVWCHFGTICPLWEFSSIKNVNFRFMKVDFFYRIFDLKKKQRTQFLVKKILHSPLHFLEKRQLVSGLRVFFFFPLRICNK